MIRSDFSCNFVTIQNDAALFRKQSGYGCFPAPVGPVNPNILVKCLHLKSRRTNHTVINSQTQPFRLRGMRHKPVYNSSHPVYATHGIIAVPAPEDNPFFRM